MDRYKFRGKRLDNGEWVEGSYLLTWRTEDIDMGDWVDYRSIEVNCIVVESNEDYQYENTHEVDPATVGQYTGLKDKNGKEIYEGDVVKQTYEKDVRDDDNCWYTTSGNHTGAVVVDKRNGVCIKNPIRYTDEDGETVFQKGTKKSLSSYRTEVIGNIHDSDLLEG